MDDGRMWDAVPSPSYKGEELGLGCPIRPIQSPGAQGIRTDPLPHSATARYSASTACHLHGGHVASEQDRGDG